jgi:hypothetical protein
MSNIIGAIRDHIKTCPLLPEFCASLGVDYLGEEDGSYMIEAVPASPVVKRFINGDANKQQVFVFSSRESYGADVLHNIENLGFYQEFADWLETCTRTKNLPDLGEGKESLKLEATTSGYAFETGPHVARYQIQCRLVYFEKGK